MGIRERIVAARKAEFLVWQFMLAKHYPVEWHPKPVAPRGARLDDYFDPGDIIMATTDGKYRVEVKHCNSNFKKAADWPYNDVIVDEVYKMEKPIPLAGYAIVNLDYTKMFVMQNTIIQNGYMVWLFDKYYADERQFWCVKPMQIYHLPCYDLHPEKWPDLDKDSFYKQYKAGGDG